MTRYLLIFAFGFLALKVRADTRIGNVFLYDYLGMEVAPIAEAEVLSAKSGLVKIRRGNQKIEHSGRFSIVEVAPAKEEHWWQNGGAKNDVVDLVVLYGFMGMEMIPFRGVSLVESTSGFLVFDLDGRRYTHCGRYEIHR